MKRSILTIAAAALFLATQARAGLVITTVVKSDGGNGNSADMTGTGWFDGQKFRLDVKESGNPMMKKGAYLVTKDLNQNMYLVDPSEKTYMTWDMKAMVSMGSFKVSNIKSETILDEKGPAMLGLPTRHIKRRVSYTMEMSMMGFKNTQSVVDETESWITTKYQELMKAMKQSFMGFKTGNPDLDKLAEAAHSDGLPLKEIRVSKGTDLKSGKTSSTTLTTEITSIKEQKIPDSMFEIPDGYSEMNMGMFPPPGARAGKSSGGAADDDSGDSPADDEQPPPPPPKPRRKPSVSDVMRFF